MMAVALMSGVSGRWRSSGEPRSSALHDFGPRLVAKHSLASPLWHLQNPSAVLMRVKVVLDLPELTSQSFSGQDRWVPGEKVLQLQEKDLHSQEKALSHQVMRCHVRDPTKRRFGRSDDPRRVAES